VERGQENTLTEKKTPPIHPHKNPVKKACPLLIDHLNITKMFSGQTQPTVQQRKLKTSG
jgi:hypothetical protein